MTAPEFLHRLATSPFARNVAVVASGTAAAQLITVVFAPVITRQYGPEAFGVLGTFTAIITILGPISALAYPIAIVLPRRHEDAVNITILSLLLGAAISVVATVIIFAFGVPIAEWLNVQSARPYLLLVPIAILFTVCSATAIQWAIRNGQFRLKSKTSVAHALLTNGTIIGVGSLYPAAAVLIIVTTIGKLLQAAMLFLGIRNFSRFAEREAHFPSRYSLKHVAAKYHDFPLYRAPQEFLNALSRGIPILMLVSLSGPLSAGLYALSYQVISLPGNLVAQAVGEVFYPKFNAAHEAGEPTTRLILRATLVLAVLGFFPFSIIIIFGPSLFSVIFGPDWVTAGEYARWLSVLLFFNFINRPCVAAIPVFRAQRGLVIYEILTTAGKVAALWMGFAWFTSDIIAVALFSLVGALAYFMLIAWVLTIAIHHDHS